MHVYHVPFKRALDRLIRIDPSLKEVVEKNEFPAFYESRKRAGSFEYLVRSILSQQVSGKAAKAICNKFLALFPDIDFPTPKLVLNFKPEDLRGAGLSMRKAEYVLGLAQAYENGELSDKILEEEDDDEVVDSIVAIRGLGPWTAHMFLIFYLRRMDVFSPGDLGIQRGFRKFIKERPQLLKNLESLEHTRSPGKSKKSQGRPSVPSDLRDMEKVAARFSPWRSAFMLILWKMSDIEMSTVTAEKPIESELNGNETSEGKLEEEPKLESPSKRRKKIKQ